MTHITDRTDRLMVLNDDLIDPDGDWGQPDEYPRLRIMSAAFMYKAMVRPDVPDPAEYVTIRTRPFSVELEVAVAQWNMRWEAAQFRRRMVDGDELPGVVGEIAEQGDRNIVFVPRTRSRYYEHAPLLHLLPRSAVEHHGLPMIAGEQWPYMGDFKRADSLVPSDFDSRLARAWAGEVWRHLVPGSPMSAFSASDPIKLLAHSLDFWIPAVTEEIQEILRALPLVDNGIEEGPVPLEDGSVLPGAVLGNPTMGSDLWRGEAEATQVTAAVVDRADSDGQLRGILEAVRSNRVEDDFSDRWSFAREDFERKLYRKRSKIKVRFVELDDTIPVQGPETEVVEGRVFSDFMTLLDERERQVVVLLSSGVTTLTEVGELLGYSNHSAISKRLKKIRMKASRHFADD